MKIKPCLFDLDGTLCDHTGALISDLVKIQSPSDPPIRRHDENEPDWVKERKRLIRSQRDWWFNLKKIQLGFDLYQAARHLQFQINILTKGPWTCPEAWSEKVRWCRKNLHDDVKITISEDKSIVYGRVLVDDYIPYVMGWLHHRPQGLIVMVANEENEKLLTEAKKCGNDDLLTSFMRAYESGRVIRYDGTNLYEVEKKMKWAYFRD